MTNEQVTNNQQPTTNAIEFFNGQEFANVKIPNRIAKLEIVSGKKMLRFPHPTKENIFTTCEYKAEVWMPLEGQETAKTTQDTQNAEKTVKTAENVNESGVTPTLLDEIVDNKVKTPKTPKVVVLPLTDEQKAKLAELEQTIADSLKTESTLSNETKKLEDKKAELDAKIFENVKKASFLPFTIGKAILPIRNDKLYRESISKTTKLAFKTFGEYVAERFPKLDYAYIQRLAQIGAFAENASEYWEKENVALSIKGATKLAQTQNKYAELLNLEGASGSEFKPLMEQIASLTIDASKDDEGKSAISETSVSRVSDEVQAILAKYKANGETDISKIVLQATQELAKDATGIIERAKAVKKTVSPVPTNTCQSHTAELQSVVGDIVTLNCGCKFKLMK